MADPKARLQTNTAGDFYVDASCINCDTCRQLAPGTFEETGEYSAVRRQPENHVDIHHAYQALVACPVGSIGTLQPEPGSLKAARDSFPLMLETDIYYCGFNSRKSFGANSYFVRHRDGNWLVDSPRYVSQLVTAFASLGGLRWIFLTHEDDVADAARYASRFGADRIIHVADAGAMPDAEVRIEGIAPVRPAPEFQIIPVPGHTPGSQALLYHDRILFSGDHLWWDRERCTLGAPERLVWDQRELTRSLVRLLDYPFDWVLPGHGERIRKPVAELHAHLRRLLDRRMSNDEPCR